MEHKLCPLGLRALHESYCNGSWAVVGCFRGHPCCCACFFVPSAFIAPGSRFRPRRVVWSAEGRIIKSYTFEVSLLPPTSPNVAMTTSTIFNWRASWTICVVDANVVCVLFRFYFSTCFPTRVSALPNRRLGRSLSGAFGIVCLFLLPFFVLTDCALDENQHANMSAHTRTKMNRSDSSV